MMAIPVTPKPAIPNVPNVPGVPILRGGGVGGLATIPLLVADAANVLSLLSGPQWGLFTASGAPAFSAIPGVGGILASAVRLAGGGGLSVGDMEYRLDYRISTAPQEQGAFLSYNKVSTPFQGKVTYVISGLGSARGAFFAAIQQMQASLTLLALVMPEYTYPSCTITHSDFRRSAKEGASMIPVDIWVEEVRITGTAAYSSTQTPAGANQVNGGTVQPQVPTPAQTSPTPPN
jgi:Dit-like tail protein